MYWNGGYFCVAFGTMAAFLLAYLADTRRNRSFGWLFFYCTYTSGLVYGVGYGLTYLFRATANALLIVAIYTIFTRQRRTAAPEMDHALHPAGIRET
jgi:ABC-type multidrug transport system permease subunit